MTNMEKIRSMTDDQFSRFLLIWGINTTVSFLEHGGTQLMNAKQQRDWLGSDVNTFVCTETRVGEDFSFDQDFNSKGGC